METDELSLTDEVDDSVMERSPLLASLVRDGVRGLGDMLLEGDTVMERYETEPS